VKFDAIFTPDAAKQQPDASPTPSAAASAMIAHADSISLISTTPGFTAPV